MVSFIQQSLEQRILTQCCLLFNSHYNYGYQNNGFFYSAVIRTKNIKTTVYFIQQSLEQEYQHYDVFYSTVTITKDIKTMISFIQQSLELRISKYWFLLFNSQ